MKNPTFSTVFAYVFLDFIVHSNAERSFLCYLLFELYICAIYTHVGPSMIFVSREFQIESDKTV